MYMAFESAEKMIHESHSFFQSRKVMKSVCGMQLNVVLRVFFSLWHIVIFNFISVYTFFVLSVNTLPNVFKPSFVTVLHVACHLSFLAYRPDS